jgi:hypothetical protein
MCTGAKLFDELPSTQPESSWSIYAEIRQHYPESIFDARTRFVEKYPGDAKSSGRPLQMSIEMRRQQSRTNHCQGYGEITFWIQET